MPIGLPGGLSRRVIQAMIHVDSSGARASRRRAATMFVLGALFLALLAVPGSAQAQRLCADPLDTRAGVVSVEIVRGSASCQEARSTLRRYLDGTGPGCGGSHCLRRVGHWQCIAGGIDEAQIASCYRGRRTIRAYAVDQ